MRALHRTSFGGANRWRWAITGTFMLMMCLLAASCGDGDPAPTPEEVTTHRAGDEIAHFPGSATVFDYVDSTGYHSLSVNFGSVDVDLNKGSSLDYGSVAFVCVGPGDCAVRSRTVERGIIVSIPEGQEYSHAAATQSPSPQVRQSLNACYVGMQLRAGESCIHLGGGSSLEFEVRSDGYGCIAGGAICAGRNLSINNFRASKNGDVYTIDSLP